MSTADADATEKNAQSGPERRAKLHNTIASLIKLRHDVIVSYCKLTGVSSFNVRDLETHNINVDQLSVFCQVMVDYTAMGHFEVYQRIIEGKERRRAVKEVAADVYPAIAETTDHLVEFNDKYDTLDSSQIDAATLREELSRLGEIIAIRSELEDQILAALQR